MSTILRLFFLVGATIAVLTAGEPGRSGQSVSVQPDDKPAFPPPPVGFDVKRDGIAHGSLAMIEYDSQAVGTKRKMQVYTPPGYSAKGSYPVLYLLHGIGGDETEWQRFAQPEVLMDNLIADKKAVPMIIVMPNGRAQKDDRAQGMGAAASFAHFEKDLLGDVIPTIEARYGADKTRDKRALAGLSMGGGQSLNFGFAHLDTFAYIGGFSSAPNTKRPPDLLPKPQDSLQLKGLWLSCGTADSLFGVSQGVHAYLKQNEIPHVWDVTSEGHTAQEWKRALYFYVQTLFR